MRRLLIGFGAASIGVAALVSACSSDDSTGTTTTDAGSDGAVADTSTVIDSGGPADTGTNDSGGGACQVCSDFLAHGPGAIPLCTSNGPPSSSDLAKAWFNDCVCASDGGGCSAQCSDTCTSFTAPTDSCQQCFTSVCGASFAACAADGADAGTAHDAGDGGDGG